VLYCIVLYQDRQVRKQNQYFVSSLQKTVQDTASDDAATAAAATKIQTLFRGHITRRKLEVG
jgi:IQ calmodulin-binding motif